MIFDKLAVMKQKKRWQKAIADDLIVSVKKHPNGNLEVVRTVEANLTGKKIVNSVTDIYHENDVFGKALLSIIGPLQSGQIHFFFEYLKKDNFEEVYSIETLESSLQNGFVQRAEMTNRNEILLWIERGPNKKERAMDFHSLPYLEAIQKVTGPLSPGQVFYFDQKPDKE